MNLLMINKEINRLKVKEDYINFLYEPKINNKSLDYLSNERSNSNMKGKRHVYYNDLEKEFSDEINQFLFSPYIKESYHDQIRNENIMKYKHKKKKISYIDLIKKSNEVKKDKYMYSNINEILEGFKFNNEVTSKKEVKYKEKEEKSQIEIDNEIEKIRTNYINNINKANINEMKKGQRDNQRKFKSVINSKNKEDNVIFKVNLNPFVSFNMYEGGDEPLKKTYNKVQLLNKNNYYNTKEGEMKRRLISINKDLLIKNKLNNEIIKLKVDNEIKSNIEKRIIEINRGSFNITVKERTFLYDK